MSFGARDVIVAFIDYHKALTKKTGTQWRVRTRKTFFLSHEKSKMGWFLPAPLHRRLGCGNGETALQTG